MICKQDTQIPGFGKTCGLLLVLLIIQVVTGKTFGAERLNSAFPPSAFSTGQFTNTSYVLAADDTFLMKVWREDDLETKTKVDRDGTVSLPLIGVVNIGGKTVREARTLIQGMYEKDYLVDPQITLTVMESTNRVAKARFTVLGRVEKPGFFEIPEGRKTVSLLEAIAMAEGFQRLANESKVTVKRKTNDGREQIFEIDAKQMLKDVRMKPFDILPGDTISVPERFF